MNEIESVFEKVKVVFFFRLCQTLLSFNAWPSVRTEGKMVRKNVKAKRDLRGEESVKLENVKKDQKSKGKVFNETEKGGGSQSVL